MTGDYDEVAMTLESLLLCRDAEVVDILKPTLERLSIHVEICQGSRAATEILASSKFDAVIVDCDDLPGGIDVLNSVRKGKSNQNSIAFALLNGTSTTTQQAFDLGAKFVLQKPISPKNAMRCFEAALNFMERERRRYFRHPVEMPVTIVFDHGQEMKATTSNLSEGGLALNLTGKLPDSRIAKVVFTLPGMTFPIDPKAENAWADGTGRVGIRFLDMAKSSKEQLEKWLSQQLATV
jgi:DNA-binding response OmpR family regulator